MLGFDDATINLAMEGAAKLEARLRETFAAGGPTPEETRRAEEFQKNLEKIGTSALDTARKISGPFVQGLVDLLKNPQAEIDRFSIKLAELGDSLVGFLKDPTGKIAEGAKAMWESIFNPKRSDWIIPGSPLDRFFSFLQSEQQKSAGAPRKGPVAPFADPLTGGTFDTEGNVPANNNPSALKYNAELGRKYGAKAGPGGYAIFPTPDAGRKAADDIGSSSGMFPGERIMPGASLAPVGAFAALAGRGGTSSREGDVNTTSHETHINQITVVTQATDAHGIARDIGPALERLAFASGANYGQTG
jgi:hypothetical protein